LKRLAHTKPAEFSDYLPVFSMRDISLHCAH
jgi:hypothetical protein